MLKRPGSSLSKNKQQYQNLNSTNVKKSQQQQIQTKEEFIKQRDFMGAVILLEFDKLLIKDNYLSQMWLAYSYFHNGDYDKAMEIYTEWCKKPNSDPILNTYVACCLYALGKYKESYNEAEKGPKNEELTNRIRLHSAFKCRVGVAVMDHLHKLTNNVQDQLCKAGWEFLKGEFEEAIDIYNKIYVDKKYNAINIYKAMCYYKLDNYEDALKYVNSYLSNFKTSVVANNLKAAIEYSSTGNCNSAKKIIMSLQDILQMNNNKNDIKKIIENDYLLKHNLAVFDSDESNNHQKLKVFQSLIDLIPESRLNLTIYYLRNDQITQAFNLMKDVHPNNTKEYILKAIIHCLLAQQSDESQEHLKKAQTYFHSIGSSSSECDTIEGRQCMASCFRLYGLHSDELIYLETIKNFLEDDDDFNWNYGIALAASQKYKESEVYLLRVKKEKYKLDQTYLGWLCRVYIMNGKPEFAWNTYISIDNHITALYVLNFIANEFYRMGHFYYSFKSFVFLEKFSPSIENSNGKIASASGVFFQVVSNKLQTDKLQEIIHYLSETITGGIQAEEVNKLLKIFLKWGKENGANFSEQSAYEY